MPTPAKPGRAKGPPQVPSWGTPEAAVFALKDRTAFGPAEASEIVARRFPAEAAAPSRRDSRFGEDRVNRPHLNAPSTPLGPDKRRASTRDPREFRAPIADNRRRIADPFLPGPSPDSAGRLGLGEEVGRPHAETANPRSPARHFSAASSSAKLSGRRSPQGSGPEMERPTTPTAWAGRQPGGSLPHYAKASRGGSPRSGDQRRRAKPAAPKPGPPGSGAAFQAAASRSAVARASGPEAQSSPP